MRSLLVLLATVLAAQAQQQTAAAFRPLHIFGDHMVLPAASCVPISGVGAPGAYVEVKGSWGAAAQTRVDAAGRWSCDLATPPRGGPFEVVLRSGADETNLRDVLAGDVWLCSGQSNMVMPLGPQRGTDGVRDWQQEVAKANHELRVFTVKQKVGNSPESDVDGVWEVCSPATAAGFSAVAYFFACELLAHGKGPIGLVVSAWGGTICEAWTSERGLAEFPELGAALEELRFPKPEVRAAQLAAFWAAVQRANDGAARAVQVPERWSAGELRSFDGVATYERTLSLPPAFRGADLELELGALDDMDTVWWNGERVGGLEDFGAWTTPRRYRVHASDAATAVVRVRIVDRGGDGGWRAAAADLRLSHAKDRVQSLGLAGEWQRRVGPAMRDLPPFPPDANSPNRPSVLWNGMIAPLVVFPFTGVLWYQGEANRNTADRYARLFPAMISDWRLRFDRELPFYFVQIAPFDYDGDEGHKTARLREAQAKALALPRTGMAVTLDCGDPADIHPVDKKPVGQRLARLALARHYGEAIAWHGPRLTALNRLDGGRMQLRFDTGGSALVLVAGGEGFEVAGEDGGYVPAVASLDGACLELRAAGVERPVHVRYAWAAAPRCSLANADGLPAPPFRASLR
jgi:sialate O-acetylesterase